MSEKRYLRQFSQNTLFFLLKAASILAFCFICLILCLRYLTLNFSEHQALIANTLDKTLDIQLTFDTNTYTHWKFLTPTFSFENLQFTHPNFQINSEKLYLSIDILSSIKNQTLIFKHLHAKGAHVLVDASKSFNISSETTLENSLLSLLRGINSLNHPMQTFTKSGQIIIPDAKLSLHFGTSQHQLFHFSLQSFYQNGVSQGIYRFNQSDETSITVQFALTDSNDTSSRFSLSANNIQLPFGDNHSMDIKSASIESNAKNGTTSTRFYFLTETLLSSKTRTTVQLDGKFFLDNGNEFIPLKGQANLQTSTLTPQEPKKPLEWQMKRITFLQKDDALQISLPSTEIQTTIKLLSQHNLFHDKLGTLFDNLQFTGIAENTKITILPMKDTAEYSFSGNLKSLSWQSHNNIPGINNINAEWIGFEKGFLLNLQNTDDVLVKFPHLFHETIQINNILGNAYIFLEENFVSIIGKDLQLHGYNNNLHTYAEFALNLAHSPMLDSTLLLNIHAKDTPTYLMKKHLPKMLPQNLVAHIRENLSNTGILPFVKLTSHQYLDEFNASTPFLEVNFALADVRYLFAAQFPPLKEINGVFNTNINNLFTGTIHRSSLLDIPLNDMNIANDHHIHISGSTNFLAKDTLIQLLNSAGFRNENWQLHGSISSFFNVFIDPQNITEEPKVEIQVNFHHAKAQHSSQLTIENLQGKLSYESSPLRVTSQNLQGTLWGEKVLINAKTADDSINLAVNGKVPIQSFFHWLHNDTPKSTFRGTTKFVTSIDIPQGPQHPIVMTTHTDLKGISVHNLPPFNKPTPTLWPTEVVSSFFTDDSQIHRLKIADKMQSILHRNESISGFVALNNPSFDVQQLAQLNDEELTITGNLPILNASLNLLEQNNTLSTHPYNVTLLDLHIAKLNNPLIQFQDVTLNGQLTNSKVDIKINSPLMNGTIRYKNNILETHFNNLHLPKLPFDEENKNPSFITNEIFSYKFPLVKFSSDQITIDKIPIGSWNFEVSRPNDQLIAFDQLNIRTPWLDLLSKQKKGDSSLYLSMNDNKTNTTHIKASILVKEPEKIIHYMQWPQSIYTKKAQVYVDLSWPGLTPWPELTQLSGHTQLKINEGLLRDTNISQSSTLSFASLFNINKLIALSLSGVKSGGVDTTNTTAFDKLNASFRFEEGFMELSSPLALELPSSTIKITGLVDLENQTLDNQMTIVLPVADTLPWYAAYLAAAAGPATGISVWLANRLLKGTINKLFSIKYNISGSINDPQIKLASETKLQENKPTPYYKYKNTIN